MAVDDMIGDSFQGLTDHIFDEVRSISLGLKKQTDTDTASCAGAEKMASSSELESNADPPCAVPAITTTAVAALSGDRLHRESRNDNTPTRNLLRPSLPTTSSDVIDAACWATLMDWLVPPPPSFSSQHASERKKRPPAQQAFFLPCSDQDVRLLAEKKSAILAHCSAMAKSRRPSDDSQINSAGGDGQRSFMPHSKAYLACSRILCPSLEAVTACRKPQIAAISGMDCFVVPDFLLLTHDVCLSEVQSFCQVEYPVMFKVIPLTAIPSLESNLIGQL